MELFDRLTRRACPPARTRATDLGILGLRLTAGGLLAGHGAQKLFGAFGGYGLEGTGGWLESLGLRPGKPWAALAGLSELGGGTLTALGLFHPLGPIALQGAMATATRKVHWNKPIWNTEGGAELPALFSMSGLALAVDGPGRYSVDRALGIRVPMTLTALAAASVAAGVVLADQRSAQAQPDASDAEDAGLAPPDEGEDRVIATEPSARQTAPDEADWVESLEADNADLEPESAFAGGAH